ncbi:cation-translocating P-type ATPase [Candidatus Daviesbacteria bacterium]|nr:cation-translocating P-type ATPase [Candidatus Daviesbacteria bacterium]
MSSSGLTTIQAQQLIIQYGLNKLPEKKGSTVIQLIFSQIKNYLFLLLLIASIISFVVGDPLDGVLILGILLLNTILGFWQEYKASKELEALRKLEVLNSRVIRDGQEIEISSFKLVPGDLVILESGDKIPADGKVLESVSLAVNESSLTGESLPVMKTEKEGENDLYFGTIVSSGRGKFQVTYTGVNTKFGKIALTLADVEEEVTPLEKSLNSLGKKIGLGALVVSIALFVFGVLQGNSLIDEFFNSTALLVAAVPEGLPAVVTIVLALGVHKMYKRKALVRKMVAVESLGAATVICSDKTGTLTQNQMVVKEVKTHQVNEKELIKCAVLCNSSSLVVKENHGGFDILGDTTEGALLLWVKEKGVDYELLRSKGELVDENPFNLKSRMMSVVWRDMGKDVTYVKGAPESILPKTDLSEEQIEKVEQDYKRMASKGLRVLAFASGKEGSPLNFLGIIGIADTPRIEAKVVIERARQAGIKVIMVTGDNELTAKAIAEEIGLIREGEEVITGAQLDELTDEEFVMRLSKIRIFARIQPEQKLRIVRVYQSSGEVVAVTGDGVNDSLALKQAHVGVAMGQTGTDVAKEASDIVLLDDNFSTLISAIEQGRLIYSNILKVVKFLLAGNLSEILLIIGASILSLPTPLFPAQILWINFVTDGFPALALGTDNASANLMKTPPRKKWSVLLSNSTLLYIFIGGLVMAAISLIGFYISLQLFGVQTARSSAFTLVVISQMFFVFILRKHHSLLSNKKLVLSVGFVLLMQALILTFEPLKTLFKV